MLWLGMVLAVVALSAYGFGFHLMIQDSQSEWAPGIQTGKVLMTSGAVCLSTTAAVISRSSQKFSVSVWTILILSIVGLFVGGTFVNGNSALSETSTLKTDALGGLLLDVGGVLAGAVVGQAAGNKGSYGVWIIALLLIGGGFTMTALLQSDTMAHAFQWGNVSFGVGGAFLSCAIGKTVFSSSSSLFAQNWSIWVLLCVGMGLGGAFIGSESIGLIDDGQWVGSLSSTMLGVGGAGLAGLGGHLVCRPKASTEDSQGPSRKSDTPSPLSPAAHETDIPYWLELPDRESCESTAPLVKAPPSTSESLDESLDESTAPLVKAPPSTSESLDESTSGFASAGYTDWSSRSPTASQASRPTPASYDPSSQELPNTPTLSMTNSLLLVLLIILPLLVISYFLVQRILAKHRQDKMQALDQEPIEIVIKP